MLLSASGAFSLYGLAWYHLLSPAERTKFDRRIEMLAFLWFQKEAPDLDEDEAKKIIDELKKGDNH
jgi:hypothetical protein